MTYTKTETHEERFHRLIGEALDAGVKCAPSRLHSLAVTHLEDAEFRASSDINEKSNQ